MSEPEIRSVATAEMTVTEGDLASALRFEAADQFPPVFATSRLVALMEVAAARLLRPHLGADELSVGVTVDIVHTAATPAGGSVVATATYAGRDGKLFVFEVLAVDDGGEVARGTHKRAIVGTSRLLSGAARRTRP
ncbi:MAG: thioesterase family protein [Thermoanaerobaculia bacterium]